MTQTGKKNGDYEKVLILMALLHLEATILHGHHITLSNGLQSDLETKAACT